MPNQIAKDLELMFEEFVEGYDSACVMSMEADKTFPAPQAMQRAGDTFYVKQDYMVSVTTGLDISAASPTDLIERVEIESVFSKAVQEIAWRDLQDISVWRQGRV